MTDRIPWRTAVTLSLAALMLSAAPAALASGGQGADGGGAGGQGTAPAGCPAGSLCAYSGRNYTGKVTRLTGDSKDLTGNRDLAHVESLYNHGRSEVTVWEHREFKGRSVTLAPEHGQKELNKSFGHKFQSQRWGRTARG
ncbi:peptidase inhibitor family I36 protein [Streptomyces sp. NPDC052396]|uniref:peptidase inhibitor family I36 protein n=1 Tax=Streptomyces sp. NPDC052396 TaxID=3365689 RepID=UPI0037D95DB8